MSVPRRVLVVFLLVLGVLSVPALALAHPLGNFTINTVRVVGRAMPTRSSSTTWWTWRRSPRSRSAGGSTATATAPSRRARPPRTAGPPATNCGRGCALRIDGASAPALRALVEPLVARRAGRVVDAPPRLRASWPGSHPAAAHDLTFEDRNYPDRLGWREVTAVGDGATIVRSDVPSESPSRSTPVLSHERRSLERPIRLPHVPAGRRRSWRAARDRRGGAGERWAPRRFRRSRRSVGGSHRADGRRRRSGSAPCTPSVPATASR